MGNPCRADHGDGSVVKNNKFKIYCHAEFISAPHMLS